MPDKPAIIYTAGSYGNHLTMILNQNQPLELLTYDYVGKEYKYTREFPLRHHLVTEGEVDPPLIKITYSDKLISIINRNKWTKIKKGHIKEQSMATFPATENRELYTMAIHVCNLLDKYNHFRRIDKDSTVEWKCEWFLDAVDVWLEKVNAIQKVFGIPQNDENIISHYKSFNKAQQSIFKMEKLADDLIARSYRLGKLYYDQYGCKYSQYHFDEVFNQHKENI